MWCWALWRLSSLWPGLRAEGVAWWAWHRVALWGRPGRSGPDHSHNQTQKLSPTLHLPGLSTPLLLEISFLSCILYSLLPSLASCPHPLTNYPSRLETPQSPWKLRMRSISSLAWGWRPFLILPSQGTQPCLPPPRALTPATQKDFFLLLFLRIKNFSE